MLLYVMRHGPAEDRSVTGRDADRALTPEGRARVRGVAAELLRVRAAAAPPRILTSPLLRARETAAIVASVLRAAEPEEVDDLHVDAPLPFDLTAGLSTQPGDALLVGHQPNVEQLVRSLLGAARPRGLFLEGFCTAMIVALEPEAAGHAAAPAPPSRWHARLLVDPRRMP